MIAALRHCHVPGAEPGISTHSSWSPLSTQEAELGQACSQGSQSCPDCPGPRLPAWSQSPNSSDRQPSLCLAVERDPCPGPPGAPLGQLHFDLTSRSRPGGCHVAGVRFTSCPAPTRSTRRLHISMFEVVLEQSNRCLPHTPPHTPAQISVRVSGPALGFISRKTEGELPGQPTLREERCFWPKALSHRGTGQHQSWIQVPILLSWLWDYGWVTELLSLSFPICTQTP